MNARPARSAGTDHALCLGEPRFLDTELRQLAQSQGALAAWQRAFAQYGQRAASRVTGPFAVALHDAQGRTYLAVDRFAVHSLCYRVVDGHLRFAARADALADQAPELDLQALFDYLYFHAIPSPRTVFQGVMRVPPGHAVLFDKGQLSVAPYWVPHFQPPSGAVSFDALKAEFRELLCSAVKRELDGSTPACFLSGGTDSSTVAGMIRQATGGPAHSYSIGFEAEGYDEMAFARIAASHFQAKHHEYYVTPDDLVRSIADVAGSYDQPFGNSSALPSYYCSKHAQERGVTKVLAGDGGDELFGGNTRYAKQRVFGWYGQVPRAIRKGLLEPLLANPLAERVPLLRKGSSYIEQAIVPMPDRLQMYNLLRRLGAGTVLSPAFLARINQDDPLHQQQTVWALADANTELDRTLAFDWRYTLAESDLPKVCGTTGLAGLKVGFPMLDQDLLDFSLRLPTDYKLKGFKLRWFFKEALRGFLPDETIIKKKQGFGLPFGVWATRHAPLKALAADSLRSLSSRGVVQPSFINQLVDVYLPSHPGYYGEMVWILMVLEQWLQRYAPNFKVQA